MIYKYECDQCKTVYDILQSTEEEHKYDCPECKTKCRRVFTVPSVKKNEGFFSETLGRWVDSHSDFEEGLNEVRYKTDQSKWVGDNSKPKDKWVEEKAKALQASRERAAKEINGEE